MRRHPLLLAGFVLLLCGMLASAVRAELSFPELTGRVVDAAGLLSSSQRDALDAKLAAQEAKVTDQFVVATVPSLEGTSIEDYANRLFRHWQIGQKDKNNGVMLLVAPNERKVRIEVGYGLEGVLPDAVASTIVQTTILPAFRSGNFPIGIDKGVDAVIEILNLDPAEAERRARQAAEPALTGEDWMVLIIMGAMLLFFAYVFYRQMRYGRSQISRRGSGAAAAGGASGWEWNNRSSGGGWSSGGGGGGFSGGGGSSGGGGASGSW